MTDSMGSIGYARVSKDDQADSLPAQVSRLESAGCRRVITDIETGRSTDRDGLIELMAMVKAGQATELLVTRVDRLGRDAAYTDALLAQCEEHGVSVRALDGGVIETATPQGFLMARLQTGLAEMESRMLSMRLRRQFSVYRAEGRHLRRRKPFGYRGGPNHHLEPNPDQWSQALRVITELRGLGSFSAVSRSMPAWCEWTPAASNLQAWFVNPVIRGHIGHRLNLKSGKGWNQQWGEIHYDQHPALISEPDWQELADLLKRPTNKFRGGGTVTEVAHGLTGLLRCKSCDHLLRRNSSNGVAWWRCRHRLCEARGGAREDRILPVVIEACAAEARRLAALLEQPQGEDPAAAAKTKELEEMESMAARNPENRAMAAAVAEQRQRIEALRRNKAPEVNPIAKRALEDPHFFRELPAHQQRAVFSMALSSVVVAERGDQIEPLPRRF
ncbi:recombinase family protein [Cyanobium sp. HWJ4-Hawea]|uniref:recombinase family protein n=1 Tax=Cyanobium sp. HWJ4-Hawea TaxID=2823713 RepID=UPI0020CD0D79|nr:recombinase family protein [Cyanobium sp. HWJ4-Hawea]MCP9808853.1 recombinase family protein [Cyanobium sp. HWJ4-Hawea]